ncbi:hypothetical protein, partial [Herbiconiux daphne]
MANPYTERLNSLNDKRVNSNVRQLSDMVGLPTRRPGGGQLTSPSGVPVGAAPIPQQPQEDESYKNTTFYNNFDHHRQNDPHFDSLAGEMTKLATGLRQQVEAGYMPPQIAQDNLKQFIQDSFHRRGQADPHLKRQAAEQAQQVETQDRSGALLNQIAQEAVMNPAKGSELDPTQSTPPVQQIGDSGLSVGIGGAQSKPVGGEQS